MPSLPASLRAASHLRIRRFPPPCAAAANAMVRSWWSHPFSSSLLPTSFPSHHQQPCRHASCGIVGLANVGKSTLFNALTASQLAAAGNFPFCTIEPNVATVRVPDARLHSLAAVARSRQTVELQLRVVDIAGLIRGASKGEGLGLQFLSNIRDVDCVLHVVRCFDQPDIVHIHSKSVVEEELLLADLATVEKRLENAKKKSGAAAAGKSSSDNELRLVVLNKCVEALNAGVTALDVEWSEEEQPIIAELRLLSHKPVLIVCNVDEASAADGNRHTAAVYAAVQQRNESSPPSSPAFRVRRHPRRCLHVSAQLEADAVVSFESEAARREFLALSSLPDTALDRVISSSAQLLQQSYYYTIGEDESRAWPVRDGCSAVEAAARIHSDIARGFISVEVMKPDDYLHYGGEEGVKAAGRLRVEGREYKVQKGDILLFRFNRTKGGKQ